MKKIIIVLIIISNNILVHGQKVKIMTDHVNDIEHYQPGINKTIGNSFGDNRNINEQNGAILQDYKRAVVVIFTFSDGKWRRGTGELINTVQNTFATNKRKYFILTANHVGGNDPIYISFNYEMAHSLNRGNDVTDRYITKVYQIPIAQKKLDRGSDLALLEVDIDAMLANPQEYEDPEDVFYNAYALGWDLNPKFRNENLANISHPRGDVKKLFINPEKINFLSNYHAVYHDLRNKKVIEFDGPWDGAAFQQRGSSGSGLIDKHSGKVLAVCIAGNTRSGIELGKSRFSSITNSWIDYDDISGFNNFLDPNNTWISTIEGGYHKDLIPTLSIIDFDLNLNNNKIEKNIGTLNAIDFYRFELDRNPNEQILGDGILIAEDETLSQDQDIVLTLNAENDDLLYESHYDVASASTQTTTFKGKSNNAFLLTRMQLKNQLIQHLRKFNNTVAFISSLERLSTFSIDNVKMGIKTNIGTAQVRAVKLPYMMPYNGRELFEENPYADLWQSNKYPASRGNVSELLYIDRIKIELKAYIYNDASDTPQCEELNWVTLQDISTGNNGGYLNLVNPNYQIDHVIASDSRCGINQLRTTLYTSSTVEKHFGSWVDYDKEATGFSYSFNNATSAQTQEANPSSNEELVIIHELPYQDDLNFENNTFKARYRVGIANAMLSTDGSGNYPQGEVEDFLLNVKNNASLSRTDWLEVSGASILMTSASVVAGQCLPVGTNAHEQIEEEEPLHQGIDETLPVYNLPLYGFGDGVCFNMLDMANTNIGSNALKFNGQMFMNVAQGSEIVHNTANKKTVSIDFLVEEANTTIDEVLFEEGGGANGLSIRRNENNIAFGVRINGQLVEIISTTIITANQMTNVTAVFDNGQMSLYINGELERTSNTFVQQNIITIPVHSDDAALGGTFGTGIWNRTVGNFHGVVDYFAYWTEALTPVMIAVFARPINQNTNGRFSDANEEVQQDNETTFSIFPNPASDHLKILVEVSKAGPLNLELFDLEGKLVYQMSRNHLSTGHQLITLKSLDLPAAQYVLVVQAGDVVRREKLLIE